MSLETLLEAARFLELQELKQNTSAALVHASSSSPEEEPTRNGFSNNHHTNSGGIGGTQSRFPLQQRSAQQQQTPTSVYSTISHTRSASMSNDSTDGAVSMLSDDTNDSKRRLSTSLRSGTREVHNKLEKNRRAHLKECFELLKRQLPPPTDDRKASNLSILHSALRFIQVLRRREREYEHEMERLAREKIAAQQRLAALKKELAAQWDNIDFNALLPDDHTTNLSSGDTPRTPIAASSLHGQDDSGHMSDDGDNNCVAVYSSTSSLSSAATTASPTSTHMTPPSGLSAIHQNGSSNGNSPHTTLSSAGTPSPEGPTFIVSTEKSSPQTNVTTTTPPTLVHHPTLHLPLSQVMSAQGLVVSPTIQLVTGGAQGLRVLQTSGSAGERQLLLQTAGTDRPLALVQTTAPHLDLSTTSGGMTLVSTSQASFRATPKGLTLANGLTLSPATVTLASNKSNSTDSSKGTNVAHMVQSHTPLSGLTPLTPLVVSQGSQVAHIIAAPSQLNGKVVTPLLKSVGSVPLVNAQYLSAATLMKPVVVVSTPSVAVTSAASLPPTSS